MNFLSNKIAVFCTQNFGLASHWSCVAMKLILLWCNLANFGKTPQEFVSKFQIRSLRWLQICLFIHTLLKKLCLYFANKLVGVIKWYWACYKIPNIFYMYIPVYIFPGDSINYMRLARLEQLFYCLIGIVVFLAYMKLLRILSFSNNIQIVGKGKMSICVILVHDSIENMFNFSWKHPVQI